MEWTSISRLTPKQVRLLGQELDKVQAQAQRRCLSLDDVLACYHRARANGWASEHGGYVPNSYGYSAECTAVCAVRDDSGTVHLAIGRGPTQSRAGGRGLEQLSRYLAWALRGGRPAPVAEVPGRPQHGAS